MDISATGMRTLCRNLDFLKIGPASKPFLFKTPITARLAYVNSNPNNTFCVGWEFEQVESSFSEPSRDVGSDEHPVEFSTYISCVYHLTPG